MKKKCEGMSSQNGDTAKNYCALRSAAVCSRMCACVFELRWSDFMVVKVCVKE